MKAPKFKYVRAESLDQALELLNRHGENILREDRLTVFFEGDSLTHYTSTLPPSSQEQASS